MNKCLVIIDVQNFFLNKYTGHVIPRIRDLAKSQQFDHIIATRFVNHETTPFVDLLGWRKMMDSQSQTIPEEIAVLAEKIFDKDRYSCFTVDFRDFLEQHKIDELYFVGMDTDCCVLKSAVDAFESGLLPYVIEDCCASHAGESYHRAGIKVLKHFLAGRIINRKGLIK